MIPDMYALMWMSIFGFIIGGCFYHLADIDEDKKE